MPLLMSIILQAGGRRSARANRFGIEIGTGTQTGVFVMIGIASIRIGETGTEIVIVIVIVTVEGRMTTINHAGEIIMNEMKTTNIGVMISTPDLGMKMNIVLGIVIVMSAIGIGNSDRSGGPQKGNPDLTGTETGTWRETEGTETEETETEEGKTEETGRGKGIETERGETEETGKGNEETGTERRTERDLINHIPRPLMKARDLLRQQVVTILDPSSKKCLLLTLAAVVLYLNIQKQKKKELDLFFSMT